MKVIKATTKHLDPNYYIQAVVTAKKNGYKTVQLTALELANIVIIDTALILQDALLLVTILKIDTDSVIKTSRVTGNAIVRSSLTITLQIIEDKDNDNA